MELKSLSSVIAAMLTFVAVTQYSPRDRSVEKIAGLFVTESGQPLGSLFEGLPLNPGAKEFRLGSQRASECASQRSGQQSLAGQLWNWLNPPAVLASACSPGDCGGHNAYPWTGWCGYSCGDIYYDFHYSDPNNAPWEDGWRWNGFDSVLAVNAKRKSATTHRTICSHGGFR